MIEAARGPLLVEGRIVTLARDRGLDAVEAIAVRDGRIVATGSPRDVEAAVGPRPPRLRLPPATVALPGIIDAHLHLADSALAARRLDLRTAPGLDDALLLIAATHVARSARGDHRSWLLGQGWSSDTWSAVPSADLLQRVAPERPAAFWSHDHHSRWVSRAALALAGIDRDTPDPEGGRIGRGGDGRPDGVLYERAAGLVDDAIPAATVDEQVEAVEAYSRGLARLGITGCHDPGSLSADAAAAGGAVGLHVLTAHAGGLCVRVHASVRASELPALIASGRRSGDDLWADRVRVGWLKLFADGAMGSRTARLLEPYEPRTDLPAPAGGEYGLTVTEREELVGLVREAATAGVTTQIHAIGDAAVREVLSAFEEAAPPDLPLLRRVEHAQLVHPDDVPRFAALGVAASVQPVHLRTDAEGARRSWGARAERAFALADLDRSGALLAFGTDAPVEPPDPWPGIALAVARQDASWGEDARAFAPGQALPLDRALRAATVGPARSAREDGRRGRLVRGAAADLVVLPAAVIDEPVRPGGALATARPLLTLLDGEETWRDPTFDP